ncbi:ferredoxin--NADP reductase [Bordetella sp. N]|uniref:ferredoxin--NADP reductase n=1 Tax=Bordetella sp. N TaxID=1746199 RepID=UPI00070A7860|nr:ferredoxin--NADP reductase [Bordetella sp. N]ALM83975.1 ferredoxin--NADP reductase [Bordetella sp. N]
MTDASKYTRQTVTEVRQWVPGKLFSLRVTRDPAFTFKAGQFARVGLPAASAPGADTSSAPADDAPTLWRAYSMVSGPLEDELEFYSIVVPEGEFSPRLAQLRVGDSLYIEKNPYGFLTIDRFVPAAPVAADAPAADAAEATPAADATQAAAARAATQQAAGATLGCPGTCADTKPDLWLIATGTGLSAYLSILRDPATWTSFRRLIVVHGVRHAEELAYRQEIEGWSSLPEFAAIHRADPRKLIYLAVATREALPGMPAERLTTLIADGRLEQLTGERLDPKQARVMLCGNPEMLSAARKLLGEMGFAPGRRGIPGNLAVENYW